MMLHTLISILCTHVAAESGTNANDLNKLLDESSRTIHNTRLRSREDGLRLPFYSLRWPTPREDSIEFADIPDKGKGIILSAKRGTDVMAPASGIVKYVGSLGKHESVVIVDHRQQVQTIFIGLDKKSVKQGQSVYAGQRFAKIPAYGSPVHEYFFELRYGGRSINPLPFMNRRG